MTKVADPEMETIRPMRHDLPHLITPLPGPRAQAVIERDRRSCRLPTRAAIRWWRSAAKAPWWRMWMAIGFSISTPASRWWPPATAIRAWWRPSSEQAARLIHMSGTDFYYEELVALAEKLAALAPGDVARRVSFGNSGAEAIEGAIKLARYATGRDKIIAFFGSFHGRTMGALSLTARKAVQRAGFGPLVPGVVHAPYPYCYRCPFGKKPDTCAVECVKFIEDTLLKTIAPAEETAAIVIEPVQGEGGYIVPPQKFFDELARVARQARHSAGFRRSAVRHGPHRQDVGLRAFRSRARHSGGGQGHRQRHAAGRHGGARGADDLAAGRARLHLRRQPGGLRRRAGDHRAAGRRNWWRTPPAWART